MRCDLISAIWPVSVPGATVRETVGGGERAGGADNGVAAAVALPRENRCRGDPIRSRQGTR